jgi:cellulose synthase/poly-beta-1,6-N-acetylglucosamine synthase-like glycosyltransferase
MIITAIVVFFCFIYILRVVVIGIAARRHRQKYNKVLLNVPTAINKDFFVSVIIPARDESKNIANCIQSLIESDYPEDCFEIIVVNDRSSDNTAAIVENIISQTKISIRLHNITEENYFENSTLIGKPRALKEGIDIAKGDYFLLTDADCIVQPN